MKTSFDIMALTLALPLLGAFSVGAFGKSWGKRVSAFVASSAVALSFLVTLFSIFRVHLNQVASTRSVDLWHWASFKVFDQVTDVSFGLYIDPLSLTLMSVVTSMILMSFRTTGTNGLRHMVRFGRRRIRLELPTACFRFRVDTT